MKPVTSLVSAVVGLGCGFWLAFCLRSAIEGTFTWDDPFSPLTLGGIFLGILMTGYAAYGMSQHSPRAYGWLKLVLCLSFLMFFLLVPEAIREAESSFAVKFVAGMIAMASSFEYMHRVPKAA